MKSIRVPLDQGAKDALDYGEVLHNRIETWQLKDEEFIELLNTGILDEINTATESMIGEYEDEWLFGDELLIALEIVIAYNKIKKKKDILMRLEKLLRLAVEKQTCIDFDF